MTYGINPQHPSPVPGATASQAYVNPRASRGAPPQSKLSGGAPRHSRMRGAGREWAQPNVTEANWATMASKPERALTGLLGVRR